MRVKPGLAGKRRKKIRRRKGKNSVRGGDERAQKMFKIKENTGKRQGVALRKVCKRKTRCLKVNSSKNLLQ